jgi:hypothetical protein
MRENLKVLIGTRWTFRGEFVKFGVHRYRSAPAVAAVHLRTLIFAADGSPWAKSLRINSNREFADLDLQVGETVEFEARIASIDPLKLTHASKVRRVVVAAPIDDLPLFQQAAREVTGGF